ncbi:MAG: hypothetical protein MI757_10825 [Pirellulales bacterium]|nr:hypothetical protein [Pirellulales bacterium]
MARKVVSRKALREEAEAAEAAPKKKKKAAPKKKTTRKKKAADAEVRLKAFWGVFNQSMKRVAIFEYSDRKPAEKKAEELSKKAKTPHFVQLVKEVLQ